MVRFTLTRKRLRELNVPEETIAEIVGKGVRLASDHGEQEPSKYGSKSCRDTLFGTDEWFQSEWEREVWYKLMLRVKGEEVRNLRRQVSYRIVVNGHSICRYVADFVYEELRGEGKLAKWTQVVEDAKGYATREYGIKRRLMLAVHGIAIRETFKEAR